MQKYFPVSSITLPENVLREFFNFCFKRALNVMLTFFNFCSILICTKSILPMSFLIAPVSAPFSFDAISGDGTASNTGIHTGLFTLASTIFALAHQISLYSSNLFDS